MNTRKKFIAIVVVSTFMFIMLAIANSNNRKEIKDVIKPVTSISTNEVVEEPSNEIAEENDVDETIILDTALEISDDGCLTENDEVCEVIETVVEENTPTEVIKEEIVPIEQVTTPPVTIEEPVNLPLYFSGNVISFDATSNNLLISVDAEYVDAFGEQLLIKAPFADIPSGVKVYMSYSEVYKFTKGTPSFIIASNLNIETEYFNF